MNDFSLLLFSVDPTVIRAAVAGGVAGIVVDWERVGKERRQASADTEINRHTLEDLRAVRACTRARVVCRINGVHDATPAELELALGAGADEILIPMVRRTKEVELVLAHVRERAAVSILVETDDAVRNASELSQLPLERVYLGLNDLSIDRGSDHLFRAVEDGTVEAVARAVTRPFGFGGLTVPEAGSPLPCRLLLGEMARLGCSFSLLRRSFHRDTRGRDLRLEVERILAAVAASRTRSPSEVAHDRAEFVTALRSFAGRGLLASPRSL
jgi:hypothetical protein